MEHDAIIRSMAAEGAERIASAIGRTPAAVRNRAGILGQRLGRFSVLPPVKGKSDDAVRDLILSAIEYDTAGGCWLWAHLGMVGHYGRIGVGQYRGGAHRASYRLFNGPIPRGLSVLHKCDVPLCVNPAHLRVGTAADNTADMMAKGRGSKRHGERNTQAKLTVADIEVIRQRIAAGDRQRSIAADFGVTDITICDIKRGRSWTHLVTP